METQSETQVSDAMLLQILRRKDTVKRARPAAEIAVKSFASALKATTDELDPSLRSTLYSAAETFFSEAVASAAKGVMLLCVFSGGGDETRMYEAMLDFQIMCGCQTRLRTAAALSKGSACQAVAKK